VWELVFKTLSADADNEYAMIDSTIVGRISMVLEHAKGGVQVIGRSKGGLTTTSSKISTSKLKQYRAIATRYDKTDKNFLAAVYVAASIILLT
jgi:hypothetical protein